MLEYNANNGATISTFSGAYFNYEDPANSEIELSDVIKGLSNICRFSGQSPEFYSVAEHSVLCSYLVAPEFAFDALMHDCAEAYTGDIPTPLKHILPDFKRLEASIDEAVAIALGYSYPMPPEVKLADKQMLLLEKSNVMYNYDYWACLDGIETPANHRMLRFRCLSPDEARGLFYSRYWELKP